MNYWKVILATMVIFGAGVLTGGLLVRNSDRVMLRRMQLFPTAGGAAGSSQSSSRFEFLRRAERDLQLTSEQRDRTEKILREGQERVKAVLEPVTAHVREEVARSREEFRAVLDPEQRARFDAKLKQPHPRELRRPGTKDRESHESNHLHTNAVPAPK